MEIVAHDYKFNPKLSGHGVHFRRPKGDPEPVRVYDFEVPPEFRLPRVT